MIRLIFVSHSTSLDNEAGLASVWNDVELSPLGLQQAAELGERYKDVDLSAVYCSDLQRSYKTAEIGFAGRNVEIVRDPRLRECDYGDLTQADADTIKLQRTDRIATSFPNGESFTQTAARMKSFLDEAVQVHANGETIMIVGHRATQYGLEHWIKGLPLAEVVTAPWKWQPGWEYKLNSFAPLGTK